MGSPGMGLQHLAKLRTKPSVPLMASGVSSRLISSTLASEAANKRRATKGAKRLPVPISSRSEEHTSELQSRPHLVCRLLLEKKKQHDGRTNLQRHRLRDSRKDRSLALGTPYILRR